MRFDVKTEPEVDIETKQAMTTVHIVNCEILSLFIYNNNNKRLQPDLSTTTSVVTVGLYLCEILYPLSKNEKRKLKSVLKWKFEAYGTELSLRIFQEFIYK